MRSRGCMASSQPSKYWASTSDTSAPPSLPVESCGRAPHLMAPCVRLWVVCLCLAIPDFPRPGTARTVTSVHAGGRPYPPAGRRAFQRSLSGLSRRVRGPISRAAPQQIYQSSFIYGLFLFANPVGLILQLVSAAFGRITGSFSRAVGRLTLYPGSAFSIRSALASP